MKEGKTESERRNVPILIQSICIVSGAQVHCYLPLQKDETAD